MNIFGKYYKVIDKTIKYLYIKLVNQLFNNFEKEFLYENLSIKNKQTGR